MVKANTKGLVKPGFKLQTADEDFQKQMDEFRDRIKQMELEMREQMMKDLGKQVPDLEDIDDDNDN